MAPYVIVGGMTALYTYRTLPNMRAQLALLCD